MDLNKKYETSEGIECNILQLINMEPEWAANIIQRYENEIAQLKANPLNAMVMPDGGRVEAVVSRLGEIRAEWFLKGQKSVFRKNKSGCCCILDDSDNIISVCGAHQEWLEKALDG